MPSKVLPHLNFNTVATSSMLLEGFGAGTSTAFVAKMFEEAGISRHAARVAAAALARIRFDFNMLSRPAVILDLFDQELPQAVGVKDRMALEQLVERLIKVVWRNWLV